MKKILYDFSMQRPDLDGNPVEGHNERLSSWFALAITTDPAATKNHIERTEMALEVRREGKIELSEDQEEMVKGAIDRSQHMLTLAKGPLLIEMRRQRREHEKAQEKAKEPSK